MNIESDEEFKKRLEWEEFVQAASKRDFEEQQRLNRPFIEKLVPTIFAVGLRILIGVSILLSILYLLFQFFFGQALSNADKF